MWPTLFRRKKEIHVHVHVYVDRIDRQSQGVEPVKTLAHAHTHTYLAKFPGLLSRFTTIICITIIIDVACITTYAGGIAVKVVAYQSSVCKMGK